MNYVFYNEETDELEFKSDTPNGFSYKTHSFLGYYEGDYGNTLSEIYTHLVSLNPSEIPAMFPIGRLEKVLYKILLIKPELGI